MLNYYIVVMKTLEDIIKLCKDEAGKIFVMDEKGDLQLVIMGVGEYQKVKSHQAESRKSEMPDPELVNREILKAQLSEVGGGQGAPLAAKGTPWYQATANPYISTPPPEIRSNGLPKQRDMREEVIDPSFDFDAPEEI